MWNRCRPGARLAPLALAALLLAFPAVLAAADEEGCLDCHGLEGFTVAAAGRARSLAVVPARFEASAHGPLACRDCHADIASIPHAEAKLDVSCGQACHVRSQEGKQYSHEALYWEYAASVHGRSQRRRVPCLLCHPAPAPPSEAERRDKMLEVRQCASCHRDSERVRAWFGDAHYLALARGNQGAPSCPDCHTAHRVWPSTAKESSLSAERLAETCGKGALATREGRGCHGALSPAAVREAGMNPFRPGRGLLAGVFGLGYLIMLGGLVVRAGIGFLRQR